MGYPEENEPPMDQDNLQADLPQAPYQPGDRFVAALERMTSESYAHLAEANLMRRIGAIERRLGVLEHKLYKREQQ